MKSLRRQAKRPIKNRVSDLQRACLLEQLETRTLMSTYYVATSGNDSSGTGSQGAPFATIQHIVGSLQPGDTVNIEPGTYTGFILGWDPSGTYGTISGTAGHPITIQKDPAASGAVIINQRDSKTHAGVDLEPGDNYVSIIGLTVDDSLDNITGTPSNPAQGEGIKVTGNNDSVIGCTVTNINYGFGIIADNANNVLIEDNNISHTHNQGNGNYGHGLYLSGTLNDAQVVGNLIYDNDYIGIHVNGDVSEGGIGLVTNALIEDNIIHDNGQNGINTDGMQNSIVENNLIYGYQYYGIAMYQNNASGPSKNNLIVNNTIVDTAGATGSALRILDGSTGNTIFNNILIGGQQGTLRISTDSVPGTQSNHNIVDNLYTDEASGNTESLAGWQQQSGQDLNSTLVPSDLTTLFVNASADNFQLAVGGPAVDTGVSTYNGLSAPTLDILNNPRPSGSNFDIGAYELQQTPPAPSLTLSGGSSVNTSATYTLTLQSSDSDDDAMNSWVINWGDGAIQTVAAGTETLVGGNWVTTTTATHSYTSSGGYTISANATDTSGSHAAGNSVGVQAVAAATHLAFHQQPTDAVAGGGISPAVVIYVEDANGNLVATDSSNVTLSVNSGPGSLNGTLTVAASNGVATFSNLSAYITGAYTLKAVDGSLTSAASGSFVIAAAAAAKLVFVQQPTNTPINQTINPAITVEVEDQYGNRIASDSSTVTLTTNTGPALLAGTLNVGAINGVATFSGLSANTFGTYTLKAVDGSLAGAISGSFTIATAPAAKVIFTQEPTTNTTPNTALGTLKVTVEDSFGNVVTSDDSTVTLNIASGPAGALLGGSITAAAVNGVATFSNVTFNESGAYTLTAKDGSETTATSGTFHVVPMVGSVDSANMNVITGWAADPNNPTASINIEVDITGGPTQTFVAGEARGDLTGVLGSANHGYTYSTPVLSVGTHAVSVYAIETGGARVLIGTTTVTSQNSLFDEHYYLQTNPDVAAAVASGKIATGYDHYILYGQFEGRSPSPYWNESWYLQENPDVAAAVRAGTVSSGFMHYYYYGQYQNRQGLLYFNSTYYLSSNPDVAAAVSAGAVTSAFEHFVLYGQYEGRSPMLYFSSTVYDAHNSDILSAVTGEPLSSDYEHFIEYGQYEGRVASNFFNEATYLLDNPDVAAAVSAGTFADGFQQWLEYGQFQGRTA